MKECPRKGWKRSTLHDFLKHLKEQCTFDSKIEP